MGFCSCTRLGCVCQTHSTIKSFVASPSSPHLRRHERKWPWLAGGAEPPSIAPGGALAPKERKEGFACSPENVGHKPWPQQRG